MQLNKVIAASVLAFIASALAADPAGETYKFSTQSKSCAGYDIKDYTGAKDTKWSSKADRSLDTNDHTFQCGTVTEDHYYNIFDIGYVTPAGDTGADKLRIPAYVSTDSKEIKGCVQRAEKHNAATDKW